MQVRGTSVRAWKILKRLQLELQFIGTEIEESGSCSEIDTSAYTYVVGRIETCLEEIDDNTKLDSARHCKPDSTRATKGTPCQYDYTT